MSNPVMQALVDARVQERVQGQAQRDAEVARLCAERLNLPATPQPTGNGSDWQTFVHWCAARGLAAFPAMPPSVALFCVDNALLGIDRLLQILEAISTAHSNASASDPTLGPMVALALDQVAPVTPPRSWPAAEKLMFLQLPRHLQTYLAEAEARREKILRQNQQDGAEARKQLAAIQKSKDQNDGIQKPHTAAA